jgi:hypothetical protein
MFWLTLFMPWMLLVHNVVDFKEAVSEEYYHKLNCLITEYVEMLEKCNNLHLTHTTGIMGEKICKLGLQFESDDHHTINTARRFMVALIDNFVMTINQDKRLQPYLHSIPFTAANIELRINFVDTCLYSYPDPNEIKNISFIDETITYNLGNPRKLGEFEKLREETLDFARLASTRY